nr:protein NRT1/ PTR FAMILY 5.5-like [Ipomoea batatas]
MDYDDPNLHESEVTHGHVSDDSFIDHSLHDLMPTVSSSPNIIADQSSNGGTSNNTQDITSNGPEIIVDAPLPSHVRWFNIAAEYALFLLMTYLTDAWGLGFAYAAGIINIWTGLSKLLSLYGASMVDKFGNYRVLLYSSIVYSIGLTFLYMSTPPVLDNMAGNCGEDRPKCYGPAQKGTFYISLVLTGVGMAGHAVSLDPFLDEQVNEKKDNSGCFCSPRNLANNLMRAVINGVSSWLLPQRWGARFGIVAIYGFAATMALAIANRFFNDDEKPTSEDNKINFCKMFNETAMVWPSFIMCGVVSSFGNTFFVEQADRMKPTAGVFTVPLGVLLLLTKAAEFILKHCYGFSYTLMKIFFKICGKLTKNCYGFDADKISALFGIGTAMYNAVLCCLVAAVVENARRKDTMKKYLHHDSKFWLVPQFVFLIGIDAFLEESIRDFFKNIAPLYKSSSSEKKEDQSMQNYIIQFTNFVMGLGFIGSVVSVLAVARISKSVTGKSWIQKEVTDSRLENYYWVLTVLSSINIVYYVFAAIWYTIKLREATKNNDDAAAGDHPQQPRGETGCCSC